MKYIELINLYGHINIKPITFPKTEMESADHVNADGARKYTQHLIEEIERLSLSDK